jgi:hypothetical protein
MELWTTVLLSSMTVSVTRPPIIFVGPPVNPMPAAAGYLGDTVQWTSCDNSDDRGNHWCQWGSFLLLSRTIDDVSYLPAFMVRRLSVSTWARSFHTLIDTCSYVWYERLAYPCFTSGSTLSARHPFPSPQT